MLPAACAGVGHIAPRRLIIGGMTPPDPTEEELDALFALALREILQAVGDPVRRPGELVPFPKPQAGQPKDSA
jgi:hypothetical protein